MGCGSSNEPNVIDQQDRKELVQSSQNMIDKLWNSYDKDASGHLEEKELKKFIEDVYNATVTDSVEIAWVAIEGIGEMSAILNEMAADAEMGDPGDADELEAVEKKKLKKEIEKKMTDTGEKRRILDNIRAKMDIDADGKVDRAEWDKAVGKVLEQYFSQKDGKDQLPPECAMQ